MSFQAPNFRRCVKTKCAQSDNCIVYSILPCLDALLLLYLVVVDHNRKGELQFLKNISII